MRLEVRREWHRGQKWPVDHGNYGGDVVIEAFGHWVRLALYYGSPPGSHIGLWRTRAGAVRGVNLRVGRRYTGPALTLLVHTRPARSG